jgi:hypothetical protein
VPFEFWHFRIVAIPKCQYFVVAGDHNGLPKAFTWGPLSWGFGVGLAMLLGCYGISLLWSARGCADHLDTPIVEKGRSIADVGPDSNRLTLNEIGSSRTPSSIENAGHDNPNPGAEHRPIRIAPEKAKVPNQAIRSQDSIGERKEANVINRRVTEFRTISHAEGEITTGWEYEDGYAGAPIRQYCYTTWCRIRPKNTKVIRSISPTMAAACLT